MRPLLTAFSRVTPPAATLTPVARASLPTMLAALPPAWAWYDYCTAVYLALTAVSLALKPDEVAKVTPWSKFAQGYQFKTPCSARTGMLVKYLLALSLSGWWAISAGGLQVMPALMLVHFGKRCIEVVCVHDFSGSPTEELSTCSFISAFYTMVAWLFLRAGVHTEPTVAALGLAVFAVGQLGNLFHHLLLARLRRSGKQQVQKYVVPEGGLFNLVSCPHYLFEVLSWAGAAIAAMTVHTWLVAAWVAGMLGGRAKVTTDWYRTKFGKSYPSSRKHIVPYVF